MDWRRSFEKMLRDQMRYAWVQANGQYAELQPVEFSEASGYILEAVLIRMKDAYINGYAMGILDKTLDTLDAPDSDKVELSVVGAEKAWLKWEGKE
jgi:hypothetical protein